MPVYSVKILQDNSSLEADEDRKSSSPLLLPTPVEETIEEPTGSPQDDRYWVRSMNIYSENETLIVKTYFIYMYT